MKQPVCVCVDVCVSLISILETYSNHKTNNHLHECATNLRWSQTTDKNEFTVSQNRGSSATHLVFNPHLFEFLLGLIILREPVFPPES